MTIELNRGQRLFQLGRHAEAASALAGHLTEVPGDAFALGLLALSQLELEQWKDASRSAADAVGEDPTYSFAWYALGQVHLACGRKEEALAAARECVRLEPDDADGFALLASVHSDSKRWADLEAAAREGLELDPEHGGCANLLAHALRMQGDREQARVVLGGQLANDPEDPQTHANQGWNELHAGDHDAALEHFREALRLDPELEWARRGVVESLAARHWFYRPVLRYFLWMEGLTGRAQVTLLLGAYFIYRVVLSGLATAGAPLAVTWTVIGVYGTAVLSTWFARPFANLLLLAHPLGRLALERRERLQAVLLASLVGGGLACLVIGLTGGTGLWRVGAALILSSYSASLCFGFERTRSTVIMATFAVVIALMATAWAVEGTRVEAERMELATLHEEGLEIVARRDELAAEGEVLRGAEPLDLDALTSLAERVTKLKEDDARVEGRFVELDFAGRVDDVVSRRKRASTLLTITGLLAVFASQALAVWLLAREERH